MGYYPRSPPTVAEYLNFCLSVNRDSFMKIVKSRNDGVQPHHLPKIQLTKAELWFYKASPDLYDSHNQTFSLTEIDDWDPEGKFKRFQILSLKRSPLATGWIKVDIRQPVTDWLSSLAFVSRPMLPRSHHSHRLRDNLYRKKEYRKWKRNHSRNYQNFLSRRKLYLNVSCKTCMGRTESAEKVPQGPPPADGTDAAAKGSFKPFFMIDFRRIERRKTADEEARLEIRSRRGKRNLNCSPEVRECCREKLHIDFEAIGLKDFVLFPKNYNAYFCRGSCDSAAANALRSSHNTIIKKYINKNGHMARRLGITTCCAATEFTNLEVIRMNPDNSYAHEMLPNMVVQSCGCM